MLGNTTGKNVVHESRVVIFVVVPLLYVVWSVSLERCSDGVPWTQKLMPPSAENPEL